MNELNPSNESIRNLVPFEELLDDFDNGTLEVSLVNPDGSTTPLVEPKRSGMRYIGDGMWEPSSWPGVEDGEL